MARSRLIPVLALVAAVAVGCGDDGGAAEPGTTVPDLEAVPSSARRDGGGHTGVTTDPAAQGGPAFASLAATSPVACSGDEAVVEVTWSAPTATSVHVVVEGTTVASAGPEATEAVPLPCEDRARTFVVVAVADDGTSAIRSLAVRIEPD